MPWVAPRHGLRPVGLLERGVVSDEAVGASRAPTGIRVNLSIRSLSDIGSGDPEGQMMVAGGDRGTREPPVYQGFDTAPAGAGDSHG